MRDAFQRYRAQGALLQNIHSLPINTMSIPFAISACYKGFNRAEVVDQNFIEFVQLWQGETGPAPRDDEAVLQIGRAHV